MSGASLPELDTARAASLDPATLDALRALGYAK
jgi:hypothetical protein